MRAAGRLAVWTVVVVALGNLAEYWRLPWGTAPALGLVAAVLILATVGVFAAACVWRAWRFVRREVER